MKKLLLPSIILVFSLNASGSVIPDEATSLIDNPYIAVYIEKLAQMENIEDVKWLEKENDLELTVHGNIKTIWLLNVDNNMVMQLPVHAQKVRLDLGLFCKGINQIDFIVNGGSSKDNLKIKVN